MRKFNFNNAEDLQKFKALGKEEMIAELIRSAHYTPFSDNTVELDDDITSNIKKLSSLNIAQIYKDLSSATKLKAYDLAEKVLDACGYLIKAAKPVTQQKPSQMVTNNNAEAAANMMLKAQPKAETSAGTEDDLKWLSQNVTFGKAMAAKVQNDGRSIKAISNALKTVEGMDGANIVPSPPEKVWKLCEVESKYRNMYDMAFKARSKQGQVIVHLNSKSGLFVPDKKSA